MKKKLALMVGIMACALLLWGAQGKRISEVFHVTVFHPSDLMVAERTNSTPNTNVFATWGELSNSIAANVLLSANTNVFDASNFLFGVLGTNTTVAAGAGATVGTNIVGNQRIYTVATTTTIDNLFTNDAGVVHLRTNLPITIGTNAGPPAPLYIFSGITNDSMSGVEMDFAPRAGAGANRSGLFVWMSSGDAIGGYAPAIYGLSEGTTSNGFGAYCGSVPFGLLGKVSSAGSGDSVATIGNNLGSHLGVRYGVSGVAGGPINGNTNVGVFGSGGTNANVAVGVYAELANSISTATDAKYPRSAALILNNRQTAKPLLLGYTNSTYEVFSLLANGHALLNSNDLYTIKAGAGVTLTTNGTEVTVAASTTVNALSGNFDSITVTNAVNRIRSLVPSTTLITQIDFSTGPTAYYWTNMVTNITLQITNVWVGSVSNRVLDFFFTGATNNGPNYTVTFSCPTPSGLVFRWGTYSATNGGNAFAVTNNSGAGVSLTLWDTNLIEAYYSPTR